MMMLILLLAIFLLLAVMLAYAYARHCEYVYYTSQGESRWPVSSTLLDGLLLIVVVALLAGDGLAGEAWLLGGVALAIIAGGRLAGAAWARRRVRRAENVPGRS